MAFGSSVATNQLRADSKAGASFYQSLLQRRADLFLEFQSALNPVCTCSERAKAFAPQAQLSANARAIELTLVTEPGPPCDRGMTEQIEVMVIQESTGAVGTGILTTSCGVDSVAPLVTAHAVQGSAGFKAGAATAFAFRAARQNGKVLVQTPNSLSPASPRPGRM